MARLNEQGSESQGVVGVDEHPDVHNYLIVIQGTNVGEMFKFDTNGLVLGRGDEADVQLLDDNVSRRHTAFRVTRGEAWVEDLGSRNGTFVNGERTLRHRLRDGDKVQLGWTTLLKFSHHDHFDQNFQKRVFESALRDGLTRAFNKQYFLDRLDSEFCFATRHKVPLSLIVMDIDHLRLVNEAHGAIAGDHVLQAFARRIHETIRNEDVFARYGGEEFAILCRAIGIDKAMAFGERLRRAVESLEVRIENQLIPVTVSVGVAEVSLTTEDPLALVAAADEALFIAKREGRNRVARS